MPSGSGSKTKDQTVTQSSAPWGPQQAPLKQAIGDATKLYDSGGLYITPYQGDMVAPAAPAQQQSWGMISDRAQAGSPLVGASKDYLQGVLDPGFLNQVNPGMQGVLDQARQGVNANYAQAGRTFSGAHDAATTAALAPTLYADYANKMGMQMQAAGMAPGIAQQDYFDANQLGQVGNQQQAQLQDQINAEMQRYYASQGAKANELGLYQSLVGGNYGGTTQTTQPVQTQQQNPWLTGLGILGTIGGGFLGGL